MPKKPTPKSPVELVRAAERALPAAARRAEELLSLVARLQNEIADAFYEIGVALRELDRKKRYAVLGYETFDELLAARVSISRSKAYELIAIIDSRITREQAVVLKQDKAYALARYAAANGGVEMTPLLLEQGVAVDGTLHQVSELTAREITQATRKKTRARNNARKNPERHAAEALALQLERELRARALRSVAVTAYRSKGKWRIRVEAPIDEARELLNPPRPSGKAPARKTITPN